MYIITRLEWRTFLAELSWHTAVADVMASAVPRKTPAGGRSLNADKIMPFKTPSERDPLLSSVPEDRCRLAYVIFFVHGIGHLLPWNFFITAQPVSLSLSTCPFRLPGGTGVMELLLSSQYFKMKFTCPHGNHSEHCVGFNETFENWFSLASMLPIFLMSAVNIWLQSKSVCVNVCLGLV